MKIESVVYDAVVLTVGLSALDIVMKWYLLQNLSNK